jgi:protein bicaudal C
MFDLPEDMVVDTDQVSRLMQNLDVFISIRHKPKQNVVSVIIKGIERNASKCNKFNEFLYNGKN